MYTTKLKISGYQFHFEFLDIFLITLLVFNHWKLIQIGIHILAEFDHEELNRHNARISSFVSSK